MGEVQFLKFKDYWHSNIMSSTQRNLPLVSVIIPAYNAEAFIGETLESVISQTYKNIEVLVVDDGSGDQTSKIVESFAQRDCRIILLQQKNAGVAAARNLGIKESRGEYIAPFDAFDLFLMLRPGFYRLFVSCSLYLILKPFIQLIWGDLENERIFRKEVLPESEKINVNDIRNNLDQFLKPSWKPYDQVISRRWSRIQEMNLIYLDAGR